MSNQQEKMLHQALRAAVLEAIDAVGIKGVREMSMFPSSKWNSKNDNQVVLAAAKAA